MSGKPRSRPLRPGRQVAGQAQDRRRLPASDPGHAGDRRHHGRRPTGPSSTAEQPGHGQLPLQGQHRRRRAHRADQPHDRRGPRQLDPARRPARQLHDLDLGRDAPRRVVAAQRRLPLPRRPRGRRSSRTAARRASSASTTTSSRSAASTSTATAIGARARATPPGPGRLRQVRHAARRRARRKGPVRRLPRLRRQLHGHRRQGHRPRLRLHAPTDKSPFKEGDRVYTGQQIGTVGESGNASGCHLHFEIWSAPGWYEGGEFLRSVTKELKKWDSWS